MTQIIQPRDYQTNSVNSVNEAWRMLIKYILLVLPTGAGKTIIKAMLAREAMLNGEMCMVFAHRDVLLSQISMSLCVMGVPHSFICANKTRKMITDQQMLKFGKSFYDETSPIILTSIQTFIRRIDKGLVDCVRDKVTVWLGDEFHHCLDDNSHGKCVKYLRNARGLGVTATPIRADGKGLGVQADGIFHHMIVGSSMGELISRGYLSPYKIYVPPQLLDTSGVNITANGDWNQKKLAEKTDVNDITGDAVKHYQRLVDGQQAITFCVNIAHSDHVAKQFNEAGIPSLSLSSKTPTRDLIKGLQAFEDGRIKNLVNCDLFGEGFDVPAVSVVIMLRKTESYALFKQQFGRMLRLCEGKYYGVLIDHVGNVKRHCIYGAPHDDPVWTLDSTKRSNSDGEKPEGRVCPECFNYYTPTVKNMFVCNECNHEETKDELNAAQQDFQFDEGNLVELDINFINTLMTERKKVDRPPEAVRHNMQNAPVIVRDSAVNNHIKRQNAQTILRGHMQHWCHGVAVANEWTVKTVQLEFERVFSINILKAQTLSERLAINLTEKVRNSRSG